MYGYGVDRRTILRGVAGAGAAAALPAGALASQWADRTDPTTQATFRAIVDAGIPNTPGVADELGAEHEPGGLDIGLDAYLVEYVNTLFSMGNSVLGALEDARLAEFVAKACDVAASELLARGENEDHPDPSRFEGGGPFASLSREDRLRALALLDEKEIDTARLPGPLVEGTAGLIPQLVIAFTQVIYYSEWQGYDDISAPPSEREFSETVDGEPLQSWQQTDFPGVINGAAALRGYLGTPGSSLGDGEVWKTFEGRGSGNSASGDGGSDGDPRSANGDGDGRPDGQRDGDGSEGSRESGGSGGSGGSEGSGGSGGGLAIFLERGEFTEDDYDTSGYEEPFATGSEPADGFESAASEVRRPDDAVAEASAEMDDGLLEQAREQLFGSGSGGGTTTDDATGTGDATDLGSGLDG